MSKVITGILGLSALVVSLGAAQFAVGHDLSGSAVQVAGAAQSDHVNRSKKADRPQNVAPVAGQTVVTQLSALNDTSIVIRIAKPILQRDGRALGKFSARPVACEAPASVLTETAKLMESGRCIT